MGYSTLTDVLGMEVMCIIKKDLDEIEIYEENKYAWVATLWISALCDSCFIRRLAQIRRVCPHCPASLKNHLKFKIRKPWNVRNQPNAE